MLFLFDMPEDLTHQAQSVDIPPSSYSDRPAPPLERRPVVSGKTSAVVQTTLEKLREPVGKVGLYVLLIRYASGGSRSLTLRVNGALVAADACSNLTGGWDPWDQKGQGRVGVLDLRPKQKTIRLERTEGFPHIDKLALLPVVKQ